MEELRKKFDELTLGQAALIGFGLAALYYFLFFDNGVEMERNLSRLQSNVASKQTNVADAKRSLKEGEDFKTELEELSKKYEQAIKFLPTEMDVADVVRRVTQQVRSAGASIIKVEPQENTEVKGVYEEFYIDIELQGTFAELTTFLAYLSKINRIINIRNFEMVNRDQGSEVSILTFSGQIISYRYTGGE